MSLKSRVKRIEGTTGCATSADVGAIILCSPGLDYSKGGRTIAVKDGRDPARAYVIKGPLAGEQISCEEGETYEEFSARVDLVVAGDDTWRLLTLFWW